MRQKGERSQSIVVLPVTQYSRIAPQLETNGRRTRPCSIGRRLYCIAIGITSIAGHALQQLNSGLKRCLDLNMAGFHRNHSKRK
jgi:hypothetical protein